MDFGFAIGWLGVAFGLLVPLPQLYKIFKTKRTNDVSLGTYVFLIVALISYLIHAIYIGSIVFIVAQSMNLITNTAILIYLIKGKKDTCTSPP